MTGTDATPTHSERPPSLRDAGRAISLPSAGSFCKSKQAEARIRHSTWVPQVDGEAPSHSLPPKLHTSQNLGLEPRTSCNVGSPSSTWRCHLLLHRTFRTGSAIFIYCQFSPTSPLEKRSAKCDPGLPSALLWAGFPQPHPWPVGEARAAPVGAGGIQILSGTGAHHGIRFLERCCPLVTPQ